MTTHFHWSTISTTTKRKSENLGDILRLTLNLAADVCHLIQMENVSLSCIMFLLWCFKEETEQIHSLNFSVVYERYLLGKMAILENEGKLLSNTYCAVESKPLV